MTTKAGTLLSDIKSALSKIGSPAHKFGAALKNTAATDAIYEAFLFFRIVTMTDQLGFKPTPALHNGQFVVRLTHGDMKSTKDTFSYVAFTGSKNYELHIDTFVDTRAAGARLEVDIGVFSAAAGNKCRGGAWARPTYSNLWLFIEAKYFGKSVSTTVAKGFVGTWCVLGRPGKSSAALVASKTIDKNGVKLIEGNGCSSYGEILPLKASQKKLTTWIVNTTAKLKKLP